MNNHIHVCCGWIGNPYAKHLLRIWGWGRGGVGYWGYGGSIAIGIVSKHERGNVKHNCDIVKHYRLRHHKKEPTRLFSSKFFVEAGTRLPACGVGMSELCEDVAAQCPGVDLRTGGPAVTAASYHAVSRY